MAIFTGTSEGETLIGGLGNDELRGLGGDDTLDGSFGYDSLDGGDGFDTADYRFYNGTLNLFLFFQRANFPDEGPNGLFEQLLSIEKVLAGSGNDNLNGSGANESFWGGGGNDTLNAGSGDDELVGGLGNDALDGNDGRDIARYGDAPSAVTVNLATGTASGGAGNDTLANIEDVSGSAFNDNLTGNAGPNTFDGLAGNDSMSGGDGDDYFLYGPGNNRINGEADYDILDYQGATGPISVLLPTASATGSDFSDGISGVEQIIGSGFDDTMVGDGNVTVFFGLAGNDALAGRGGDDYLSGDDGDDALVGDDGNDELIGGAGTDTAFFSATRASFTIQKSGVDFVVRSLANLEFDTLRSVERMAFTGQTYELVNPGTTVTPGYGKVDNFLFDAVYYRLAHPLAGANQNLAPAWSEYSLAAGGLLPGVPGLPTTPVPSVPGNNPNSYFDATYYKNQYADLKNANFSDLTLFQHFNKFGVWEGRAPGPAFDQFDGTRYLAENPDVAAYVNAHVADFLGSTSNGAIAHFIIYGANEQRPGFAAAGNPIDLGYVI